jgi:hypothetical protein
MEWTTYRSEAERWLYRDDEAARSVRKPDASPQAAALRATELRDRIEAFYRVAKLDLAAGNEDSSAEFQSLATLFSAAYAHMDRMGGLSTGHKSHAQVLAEANEERHLSDHNGVD